MADEGEKRPRGRPRTVDRDEVVEKAMATWWAHGVEAVSLNAITRTTGLSKSSLYREFGGEDGLMAAALGRYRELAVLPLLNLLGMDLDPVDTLERIVVSTTEPGELPPGCFFTRLRLRPDSLGQATAAAVQRLLEERRFGFEQWFRRLSRRGAGNPDLSPEHAARYFDAQLTLVLVRAAAGDPLDAIRSDARLAWGPLLGEWGTP